MRYFVYLLISQKNGKLFSYVGYNDLKKRIDLHNSSKGLSIQEEKNGS